MCDMRACDVLLFFHTVRVIEHSLNNKTTAKVEMYAKFTRAIFMVFSVNNLEDNKNSR